MCQYYFLVFDNQSNDVGVREVVATLLLDGQLKLFVVLHHVVRFYLRQVNLEGDQLVKPRRMTIDHSYQPGIKIEKQLNSGCNAHIGRAGLVLTMRPFITQMLVRVTLTKTN